MIRFDLQEGKPVITTDTRNRCSVYLDNCGIIDLSKGDANRRKRFVDAIRKRGSLLFSWSNAVEIAGPKGSSANAVKAFLNALGSNWVPLEGNPWTVFKKEQLGLDNAPISDTFIESYFRQRAYEQTNGGNNLLSLASEDFFQLGVVVDWVHQHKSSWNTEIQDMHTGFLGNLRRYRAQYDQNHASLDAILPPIPFDGGRRTAFVLINILRTLVIEAKSYQFTRNDVMDFCHAVVGLSAANIATLDKQWKRRVEMLPQPNGLAPVFYGNELDQLVDRLEQMV